MRPIYRSTDSRKRGILADDHELMIAGIRELLASEYEVVGTAKDGRKLLQEVERLKPDFVVLEVGMPLLNGIEAARRICSEFSQTKIIFFTQQLSPQYVQAAFRAGARGYAAKQAPSSELLRAISTALNNEFFVSALVPSTEPGMLEIHDARRNPAELFGLALTPRQREVLQLVAEGKSSKEIAAALGISVKTVEFHRASMMDQLGLRTTAELTRYAISAGIVTP